MDNIKSTEALKALGKNSWFGTKKAFCFSGRYLKQVGMAFISNPRVKEEKQQEEQNEDKLPRSGTHPTRI